MRKKLLIPKETGRVAHPATVKKTDWVTSPPPLVVESLSQKYGDNRANGLLNSFLPSTPPRLAYLLGRIGKGDQILQRLLTNRQMGRPWTEIRKRIREPHEFDNLWGEIVVAYQNSGEKRRLRSDEKKHFLKISKDAVALSESIKNGALDRRVFQYYPDDVGKLNFGAEWGALGDFDRDQVALRAMGGVWPSLREVLDGLSARANVLAKAALTKPVTAERETRDQRLRYFTQELSAYFRTNAGGPLDGCVAAITSVVFQKHVDAKKIKQLLRHTKPKSKKGVRMTLTRPTRYAGGFGYIVSG